jgi:hypothetical protein
VRCGGTSSLWNQFPYEKQKKCSIPWQISVYVNVNDAVSRDSSVVGAPAKQKEAVRSAEKARTSTCLFADRVANASISAYQARGGGQLDGKQTVLAAILAHDQGDDSLTVLSFGVGTQVQSSCQK